MMEQSAGCVLVQRHDDEPLVLLIRVRAHGFELPKGHIEEGETPEAAALRELREETGLESEVEVGSEIGSIAYEFPHEGEWLRKRVRIYSARCIDPPRYGSLPERTREIRWISPHELLQIRLVNENLRAIISMAFASNTDACD